MKKNSAPRGATYASHDSKESHAQYSIETDAHRTATVLAIGDTSIRRDAHGRYCLNDLHRAAGGVRRHSPSLWLSNQQTKELVQELELGDTGIPVSVIRGGRGQGTYVARELVYGYAMWVSPSFHLKVVRAYDALVTTPVAIDPAQLLSDPAVMRQILLEYSDKLIEQSTKVAALNRIAASDGALCVSDTAKLLQIPPRKLFDWLAGNRWIFRRPGCSHWVGYQPRIQSGDLRHKIGTFTRSDGTERVTEQVLVTSKGVARLAELLCVPAGGVQ
jgi:phage antirepressor YoqD-like protein